MSGQITRIVGRRRGKGYITAQGKLLTNNATLHLKSNGDVYIKQRRLLGIGGIIAGMIMALFGLVLFIHIFSSFNVSELLFAVGIFAGSYAVMRSVWEGFQRPDMVIEKARGCISQKATILGGAAEEWNFAEFSAVSI